MCHIFSNDHPEKARVMVWVHGVGRTHGIGWVSTEEIV